MDDCIFCKIVKGEISSEKVKEGAKIIVFKDINPQASVHLLLVPKVHIADIREADDSVWTEIKNTASELAREKNLKGFRLVHNAGESALIKHMHVHFLGEVSAGRKV